MRKFITFGVVLFQVWGASAYADSAADYPERTLMESLLALSSQKISESEFETRVRAELATYSREASPEGQQLRMERALIDLEVFTPAQAHSFMLDSQNSISKLLSQARASNSPEDLQSSVFTTMNELAALHPVGAEFSACNGLMGLGMLGVDVGITMVAASGIQFAIGQSDAKSTLFWGGVSFGVGVASLSALWVLASQFSSSDCDSGQRFTYESGLRMGNAVIP